MSLLSKWYRRLVLAWNQPSHWQLRPRTVDRRVFRTVVLGNEYRLPARFRAQDVILDVGAHIGSFGCAVLRRGAGLVCCCEADEANFRQLRENLAPYGERAQVIHGAVWKSDETEPLLHFRSAAGQQAGLGGTAAETGTAVPVVRFDELVEQLCQQRQGKIRLLKLNCAGSEWPILLTSQALTRIDAICGEYHLGDFPAVFRVPGHARFTTDLLKAHLSSQGFKVALEPSSHDPQRGLFFAQSQPAQQASRKSA